MLVNLGSFLRYRPDSGSFVNPLSMAACHYRRAVSGENDFRFEVLALALGGAGEPDSFQLEHQHHQSSNFSSDCEKRFLGSRPRAIASAGWARARITRAGPPNGRPESAREGTLNARNVRANPSAQ